MITVKTLIPQYSKLHQLLWELSKASALTFEQQQFLCDFYNNFSDLEAIEQMLISLLETHKANSQILIKSLQAEVLSCIEIFRDCHFIHFDIEKTCDIFSKQYDNRITHQLTETRQLSKKLNTLYGALDAIGYRKHSEQDEKLLWDKYEDVSKKYNTTKQVLEDLYRKQKEAVEIAFKYEKNHFPLLLTLNLKIKEVLNKYIEKERENNDAMLFPMELIANVHNLCNERQFEGLSEFDFYTALNNPKISTSLIVKKGERIRVCYLIYKLYDSLNTPNKADWRNQILATLDIKERFYQSKYKEAGQDSSSDKSFEFARELDKLFT